MSGRTRCETTWGSRSLLGLVLAVALLLVGAAGAQAATFTVNTTADHAPSGSECSGAAGDCSLRQAIDKSNGTTTSDTINVPAGHYTLTIAGSGENNDQTGDLDINKATGSVTITGAGARSTTIDAAGLGDRVLQVFAGTATVSGFTITGGSTPSGEQGGGIVNDATVTVTNSTFTGNTATGSSNGDGGGIANPDATSMTLVGDTFTNNTAGEFGGGVDIDSGTASITNTTIVGNVGPGDGGGLDIDTGAAVSFVNDTITNNTAASGNGGGVWVEGSNVSFLNTIVANNTGSTSGVTDCNDTTATDNGHNLQGTPTCFTSTTNGDITGNPVLGPLHNNGGQTDTEALLAGSPAINAGTNSGCPATDQRGVTRPQGPRCDIGAYEATPPIVTTGSATAVTTSSATINGTVNPDNLATTYHFEWGTTIAYGHTTPSLGAGSDYSVHSVLAAISGLKPATTYHFRIVATNSIGTSVGTDRTFTTPKARMRLTVSPHSARAGHRVCYSFKATSSGHGVKGVKVRFANHTAHTGSSGKARVCVTLKRGTYHAHATKTGFRSVSATVRVRAAATRPTGRRAPSFTG
jgi:hypothetical protein